MDYQTNRALQEIAQAKVKANDALGGYQPSDVLLASIAGLTFGADNFIYGTGSNAAAAGTITVFGRSLIDDANASDALSTLGISTFVKTILDDSDAVTVRGTIGLGTAAVKNTGTSGNVVPLLDGVNVWSAAQDIQAALRCDSFRLDQAPIAEVIVCTHTITISVDGTDYKIPLVVA